MIGYIYKCECLITGKIYIGQTIQDYKERWRCHIKSSFNEKDPGYDHHFHRAIRKYGKENFKWEIIETITCEELENLRNILNSLEIKYISMFDSYKNGYNSTLGGDSSRKEYKIIVSYSEIGEKLHEFETVHDASKYYNISKRKIWENCNRDTYYVPINNEKIIFRYDNDIYSIEDIEKVKSINYNKGVKLFDIDGNFIREFVSPSEAAKYYNLTNERITACCIRRTSFVQIDKDRFIFKYSDDFCTESDIERAKKVKSSPRVAVRCIDSITGEILGEYKTQSEAGRVYNVQGGKISEVCSGKRKSAGKFNGHPLKWEII